MRTYIQIQQDKKRVDDLTQEWLDFCDRDHKIHMALGVVVAVGYVVGMAMALSYENILVF